MADKLGLTGAWRGTETSSKAFFSIDKHGTILCCNELAANLLGIAHVEGNEKKVIGDQPDFLPQGFHARIPRLFAENELTRFKGKCPVLNAWLDIISFCSNGILSVSLSVCDAPSMEPAPRKVLVGDWHPIVQDPVTKAVVDEREKIGKELHDNVNQILGATKLFIEKAKTTPEDTVPLLEKSATYLDSAIEEIRQYSKKLVADSETKLPDLLTRIHHLIADLSLISSLQISFECTGLIKENIHEELSHAIFRIIQEQLNNILKHAAATNVCIKMVVREKSLVLTISDNGKGCVLENSGKGIGLRNIVSRASAFEGKVDIDSRQGGGFNMTVCFPAFATTA